MTLEYKEWGSGEEMIFCFHGFGRVADDFEVFVPLLRPSQSIISFNLFAHGKSTFPQERIDGNPLQPSEWKGCMDAFCEKKNIRKFSLLGYSMGGRIAMKTLELMPSQVQSLLLIAPDGLKINMLYRFASGTQLGKSIYRSLIKNPSPLFSAVCMLNKAGLLSDKLYRFVHVHMDTESKRQQVHDAWLIYKEMFPKLPLLADLIKSHHIRFNMIFGRNDSVIRPLSGEKFSRLMGTRQHLHIIDSGHRLINEATVKFIEKQNLWV